MSSPMYIIVGRLKKDGNAVLRTAYSPIAFKAEISSMSEYRAVTWEERAALSHALAVMPWLNPSERRALSRKLTRTINLF